MSPLVAVWLDDALHFSTGAAEQKAVNLRANPHVLLTTGCNRWDRGLDVVVEGEAIQATDDTTLKRLADAWRPEVGWTLAVRRPRRLLPPRSRRSARLLRGAHQGPRVQQGHLHPYPPQLLIAASNHRRRVAQTDCLPLRAMPPMCRSRAGNSREHQCVTQLVRRAQSAICTRPGVTGVVPDARRRGELRVSPRAGAGHGPTPARRSRASVGRLGPDCAPHDPARRTFEGTELAQELVEPVSCPGRRPGRRGRRRDLPGAAGTAQAPAWRARRRRPPRSPTNASRAAVGPAADPSPPP